MSTFRKDDLEAGSSVTQPLYPTMPDDPRLRWGFIRKVYSIVAIQLILTSVVAYMVIAIEPIKVFLSATAAGIAVYILLIIAPFIVMCPLYYYYQRHPWNYLLLAIFTVTLAFPIGMTCAFTSGGVNLSGIDYFSKSYN